MAYCYVSPEHFCEKTRWTDTERFTKQNKSAKQKVRIYLQSCILEKTILNGKRHKTKNRRENETEI